MTEPWWRGLVEVLKRVPDDHVITWYSDDMNTNKPWEVGYVDVWLGKRQAWTIGAPWESDEADNDILWPPDYVCLQLFEIAQSCTCGKCYSFGDTVFIPLEPNAEQLAAATLAVRQAQQRATRGYLWHGIHAWSQQAVCQAIEDWCLQHVGRFLQARWDDTHGPSPFQERIDAVCEGLANGTEPTYLIKPGAAEGAEGLTVLATEGAMEVFLQQQLLNDPDTM